jgi:hypothetical protein
VKPAAVSQHLRILRDADIEITKTSPLTLFGRPVKDSDL